MKITHSSSLLAGALVASLLTIPSFAEAKAFGYTNVKAGYSYENFHQSVLALKAGSRAPLKGSSSAAIPLGISAGFGYYFNSVFGLRVEAEYLYRLGAKFQDDVLKFGNANGANPDLPVSSQAQIQSLLGNVYLDLYVASSVNFYLSAGAGSNFNNLTMDWHNSGQASDHGRVNSLKKSTLTWQVGAGIGIALGKNLGLDFNVRYIDFGKAKIDAKGSLSGTLEVPFTALEGLVGLSYRF